MQLDYNILYFFNQTLSAHWLDSVMTYVTEFRHWIPLYLFGAGFLMWKFRWRGLAMVVVCIVLTGVADLLTNRVIKEAVARPRPCADTASSVSQIIRLPDGPRAGYSFPSSHALNTMTGFTFFIFLFSRNRKLRWLIIPAIIPGLSRVYLGLHYPSDVLGGFIIGTAFGWIGATIYKKLERKFLL